MFTLAEDKIWKTLPESVLCSQRDISGLHGAVPFLLLEAIKVKVKDNIE